MKGLRWIAVLSVVGGAILLSGCQTPMKWITRDEYDQLKRIERLNANQQTLITSLTNENARLKLELTHQTENAANYKNLLDKMGMTGGKPAFEGTGITTEVNEQGVAIVLDADVFFSSGSATLKSEAEKSLKGVVEFLQQQPNMLAINGYTDSDPIKHSAWKSNFELSGARALGVLEFLKKQGIAPDRMHFAGFGEFKLKYDPAGKEDKKRSRRAEIVLLNAGALDTTPMGEPQPVTPK